MVLPTSCNYVRVISPIDIFFFLTRYCYCCSRRHFCHYRHCYHYFFIIGFHHYYYHHLSLFLYRQFPSLLLLSFTIFFILNFHHYHYHHHLSLPSLSYMLIIFILTIYFCSCSYQIYPRNYQKLNHNYRDCIDNIYFPESCSAIV